MEPTITTIYVTIKDDYRPKLVLELLDGHVDNLEIDLHGIIVLPKTKHITLGFYLFKMEKNKN